jgi:tetratricopeptide (TPR) repeat protein
VLTPFVLALFALPAPQDGRPPQPDAIEVEWNAALGLKQQNKWPEAAAAFDAFAKSYPGEVRAVQARVEESVCWIGLAKSQQVLHQNTPESTANFKKAGALVERLVAEKPADPLAPRAQYLVGQVALYLGDADAARKAFDTGLAKTRPGDEYVAKLLDRRAFARRMLLDNQGALADLQESLKLHPATDPKDPLNLALRLTQTLDKPAPAWRADHWALSEPLPADVYAGDVVVLFFLASWCDKCAREREYEKDLKKRYEPLGVRFVGVVQPWQQHNGKTRHTLESFTAFAAASGYGFPLLLDAGEGPGATAAAFGCESLPDMAVIDRAGRVRWHDHPANLLDVTLRLLLAEESGKPR